MRASRSPGQLASIIYTSGTTGEPKGVMLTHTNICSNATDSWSTSSLKSGVDLALSFLPLAHIYGRTMDYVLLFNGISIAYVEDVNFLSEALLEVKPTVLASGSARIRRVPPHYGEGQQEHQRNASFSTGDERHNARPRGVAAWARPPAPEIAMGRGQQARLFQNSCRHWRPVVGIVFFAEEPRFPRISLSFSGPSAS